MSSASTAVARRVPLLDLQAQHREIREQAIAEVIRGRRVTAHNNLLGDVKNYGAVYVDQDVVVDGDLVTGRTGGHCHLFASQIIDILAGRERNTANG